MCPQIIGVILIHGLEYFQLYSKVLHHDTSVNNIFYDNSDSNILKPFLQSGYHGQPCCFAGRDYDDVLDDDSGDVIGVLVILDDEDSENSDDLDGQPCCAAGTDYDDGLDDVDIKDVDVMMWQVC